MDHTARCGSKGKQGRWALKDQLQRGIQQFCLQEGQQGASR